MEDLIYSAANEDDIAFISEVYNENIDALHGVKRSDGVWRELLSHDGNRYYIVGADVPVAWFRIDEEDGGLWLGMLQVKPAYQRRGIGRYVLSVVEDIAKEMGYRKLGIHTTEGNLAARALYCSAGYTAVEIGPCTTADGAERVGYTFEKKV